MRDGLNRGRRLAAAAGFACGGWKKNNPIPADQNRWSVYSKLSVDNQRYLWGILEDAAKPASGRTPTQQKIGDYFAACMNEEAIERAGLGPIEPDLEKIAALVDRQALAKLLGELHLRASDAGMFFGSGVQQDARDASKMIAAVGAGGLGLPDRDYYTKTDAKSVETRARYVEHVAKMFELLGDPVEVASANAATVMRIETALAKASLGIGSGPVAERHRAGVFQGAERAPHPGEPAGSQDVPALESPGRHRAVSPLGTGGREVRV